MLVWEWVLLTTVSGLHYHPLDQVLTTSSSDFCDLSLSKWTLLMYIYLQYSTINLHFEVWRKCSGKVWSIIIFTYIMVAW